ncbi:MAG: class I SAM-dependent methyltransferase [Gammaproteobacteria bacterium]
MKSLYPLLKCPACGQDGGAYALVEQALVCGTCDNRYVLLADDIPWFFPDPEVSFLEWKSRFNGFLHINASERQGLKAALRDKRLSKLSQKRLRRLLQARQQQRDTLVELLAPLQLDARSFEDTDAANMLRSKIPKQQGLVSYYTNIFRDWAWDNGENEAALEAVDGVLAPALANGDGPGKTLTLGGGACRLPYDIHRRYAPALSVALDFNPLLLLVAAEMIRGRQLKVHEFPVAPLDQESFVTLRSCRAPEALGDSFHLLLADAMNPPFASGSFDTVVTPWLIDIIPQNLRDFIPRVNRVLKKGGLWVNTGSLAFFHRDDAWCYSQDEVLELVEKNGFEVVSVERRKLPYLQSPSSGHGRVESVLSFSATKRRDTAAPPRFESLPEWILDAGMPVPDLAELAFASGQYLLQAQALSAVDGKRSIAEIAASFAGTYGLGVAEAEHAVKRIFTEAFEAHLREKPSYLGGLE